MSQQLPCIFIIKALVLSCGRVELKLRQGGAKTPCRWSFRSDLYTRSVAEKCKKLRQEKGWSIEVAAEKVDISVDAYKDAESARHEPSIRKVIALARAFNVAVSYLLGENAFISEEVYEAYYALGKVFGIK